MIANFELTTSKPTGGKLSNIQVTSLDKSQLSPALENSSWISAYPAGRWLIDLLCLIPLHLAITDGNRFVPLKDGIWSSDYERSLLGLSTMEVSKR
jgi:hypothetical protein